MASIFTRRQFRFNGQSNLFSDLLVDDMGDIDVVIRQWNRKLGAHPEFVACYFQFTPDNSFLLYSMYDQLAFCPDEVFPVCFKIDLFDDLSGKTDAGVFAAFQVIFIEMFALQGAVEPIERTRFY